MLALVKLNGQNIDLKLTDAITSTTTVDDATVVGTLYSARSKINPANAAGSAVTGASGLTFAHQTAGLYRAQIPATFDPAPGSKYVLVVDATSPSYAAQHWEIPVQVGIRTS